MKNLYLFFLIPLFIFVSSCDDKDEVSIELSKTAITMGTRGGTERVEVYSDLEWTLESAPYWITVAPFSTGFSGEIIIDAEPNADMERRTGSLVFLFGKVRKTIEIEQLGMKDLDPFIELSKNLISLSVLGDSKEIKLTTNVAWKVSNVPSWISVSPMSGDKSADITISVNASKETPGREAILKFTSGKIEKTLNVSQSGQQDIIQTPALPIFKFNSVKFSSVLTYVDAKVTNLYINDAIKGKVYLGNILCPTASSNTDIYEFKGYTFYPITISTSLFVKETSKTYIPSLAEQNAFAKQIADQKPSGSYSASSYNNTEYYSYKRLHAIGLFNLGLKLDEIVSGNSFKNVEMTKKCGIIYSFRRNLCTLDMDFPDDPDSLVKEAIKAEDKAKGVSYVASVNYGRIGLLIIESDHYAEEIKAAVDKVLNNTTLSEKDNEIIKTSDFYHIHFDNDKNLQVEKGKVDVIKAYNDKKNGSIYTNWYPVTFSMANLSDNGMSEITYSVKISQQ